MSAREPFPGLTLEGDTALVTGGASGIGLETALTLADLGADVAIFDRNGEGAEAAPARIRAAGRRSVAVAGDVASEEDVTRAFATTREQLGDVSVAVACAGILGDYGPIDRASTAMFDDVLGVNVRGGFLVIRAAAEQMRRRGTGSIVLLSSLDGLQAEHGMAAYCTSKGALLNLARAASVNVAREGIRVNAVCPSVTLTPLPRQLPQLLDDGADPRAGHCCILGSCVGSAYIGGQR